VSDLGRRIAFTLGALLIYRLGLHIPVPGLDWSTVGSVTTVPGSLLQRVSLFALGILPYIAAAILIQFVVLLPMRMRRLAEEGERGRTLVETYTRCLAVLLASCQGYGLAIQLEAVPALIGDPGLVFRISTALAMAAGTLLLAWLCGQITSRGIGNGIALVLAVDVVVGIPGAVLGVLESVQRGEVDLNVALAAGLLTVAAVVVVVAMESARRDLRVDYAARQRGAFQFASRGGMLSLKFNNAGAIVPEHVASWILYLPLLLLASVSVRDSGLWPIAEQFTVGRPGYITAVALILVICVLVYTAALINPERWSDKLEAQGASVEGLPSGEPTAAHLDRVISRLTVVGALYLAFAFAVPELLISRYPVPFYFSGISLMIVVCTVMDLLRQVRGEARRMEDMN
jgi:preprotein translocase subunit SecY